MIGLATALASASVSAGMGFVQATAEPRPAETRPLRERPITVTGERQAVQTSIDRISYSIRTDLQASSGSLADFLRNVPSVEVDPLGTVSIRGDPNVLILIDGQPAGSLRGPNRGAVLQQMSADRYERVEVITNPSAAYGPEGTGGVINLVPRRNRSGGLSGSTKAFVGGRGRANAGVAGSYGTAKTTLSGDLGLRRDELAGSFERNRVSLDPATGSSLGRTAQTGRSDTQTRSGSWRAGIEQSAAPSLRLTAEANGSVIRTKARIRDVLAGSGPSPALRTRRAQGTGDFDTVELRGRVSRSFGSSAHRASADLSYERSSTARTLRSTISGEPTGAQTHERFTFAVDQRLISFKPEYQRPLAAGGRLQLGLEYEGQKNAFETMGARGPDEQHLSPLPDFSNAFRHQQDVYGLYATLEKPFGRLTILPGLRLEHVDVRLLQLTGGTRHRSSYTRLYPTFHATRDLGSKSQLKASYSRRVQRPGGQDLNPFREYRDPLNVRAGNPDLKPQVTDSFEFGWQRRHGSSLYQATVFHRRQRDAFTDVVEVLDGDVLLTTRANLGSSRTSGLELVANRKIGTRLTLNASATLARLAIRPGLPGFDEHGSAWQIGGRANVSWQPTKADFFQIGGFLTGKNLRPQGHRAASGMINAGYRRTISDTLSAVVTVRDLLGRFGETIVYEDSRLRDRAKRRFGGRIIMIGLTKRFAGKPQGSRDRAFDYDVGRSE